MTDVPWFGPPGAYNEPDPYIWWIATPVVAYIWAILLAGLIVLAMDISQGRR